MRKFLLILCVAFASLGTHAIADQVVTFDFSNPTALGLEERDYYLTDGQTVTVDGVTLTFNVAQKPTECSSILLQPLLVTKCACIKVILPA